MHGTVFRLICRRNHLYHCRELPSNGIVRSHTGTDREDRIFLDETQLQFTVHRFYTEIQLLCLNWYPLFLWINISLIYVSYWEPMARKLMMDTVDVNRNFTIRCVKFDKNLKISFSCARPWLHIKDAKWKRCSKNITVPCCKFADPFHNGLQSMHQLSYLNFLSFL